MEVSVGRSIIGSTGVVAVVTFQIVKNAFLSRESYKHMRLL